MQAYKNDPTIMSWNLINEPRCDKPNCAGLVQSWIEKQSAYLKTVDPNHLVTVGEPHRAMTLPINASGAVQHALSSSSLLLRLHDIKVRTAQHHRHESRCIDQQSTMHLYVSSCWAMLFGQPMHPLTQATCCCAGEDGFRDASACNSQANPASWAGSTGQNFAMNHAAAVRCLKDLAWQAGQPADAAAHSSAVPVLLTKGRGQMRTDACHCSYVHIVWS